MRDLSKVVWAEGIFLGQQHFQAWDRYLETSRQLHNQVFHPFAWGVLSATIDEKALENGRFRLQQCTAVFPDGRLVDYDAAQDLPLTCELHAGGGQTVELYLAISANHQVEGISGYPGRAQISAWRADYRQVVDEYDINREREVLVARPNLVLLTGDDAREQFVTFKIAEVANAGDGSYRLRSEFVPPVVRIGASTFLLSLLNRMIEGIGARLRSLNDRKANFSGGPSEFARVDPAQFILLRSLSAIYPQLQHFHHHHDLHPELLYRLLSQAVGGLCAFTSEHEAAAIPAYQHNDLATVFRRLEEMLEEVVNITLSAKSAALKLVRETDSLLCASDIDDQSLSQCTLFFEVLFEADDPVWITDFARQVKASSRGTIEITVASALPGVHIVHTQRPPSKLSLKSGFEYFRIEARGDFWNKILEERSLALFLPQRFSSATVNLVSVQE